jgi:hypothetical protein
MTSHEIAAAAADLATVEALRERVRALEADNAVLRRALLAWIDADGTMDFADADEELAELARSLRATDHPGAQLAAELEAARAVVAAARTGFGTEEDIRRAWAFDPNLLTARIRAYDETTKARQ